MIPLRSLLSLVFIFAFTFLVYGNSQAQKAIPHPPGMQLVIDHSYDIHPKEVNEILKCCHPLWPGIKNLGQANHARTKGDVQIFKIVHKKYDFAAIYDGDCVVISLAETHF